MNGFALVVLTDQIKVRQFEHKDDFDMARQTLVASEIKFIPLKWVKGTEVWIQPEMLE